MMGLDWPDSFDRTPAADRQPTSKFSASSRQSRKEIKREMERIDADQWALEEANGSNNEPGVVLRWRDGVGDHAIACDFYTTKKANLRTVFHWLHETRKRNDRPVVTGAGDGFAAAQLPSGDDDAVAAEPPAHEVLGVAPDAPETVVEAAARSLKKEHHPDAGGDETQFKRVVDAEEAMLDES